MTISISEKADGLAFAVHVQPRSSRLAIVGQHDKALKIKLTAPPVGGAANKQCIQLLAKSLGVARSAITITSGASHRRKQIHIQPAKEILTPSGIAALKKKLIALSQKST